MTLAQLHFRAEHEVVGHAQIGGEKSLYYLLPADVVADPRLPRDGLAQELECRLPLTFVGHPHHQLLDYGKLRHLLTVNRQLNGNFELLRHLIGAGWVDGELRSGFPLDEPDQRDNFVSLLHYFGLLSIREVRDGMPRLAIPNQTVRRLMYGYLRGGRN